MGFILVSIIIAYIMGAVFFGSLGIAGILEEVDSVGTCMAWTFLWPLFLIFLFLRGVVTVFTRL